MYLRSGNRIWTNVYLLESFNFQKDILAEERLIALYMEKALNSITGGVKRLINLDDQ